jgi:hypothetical protein
MLMSLPEISFAKPCIFEPACVNLKQTRVAALQGLVTKQRENHSAPLQKFDGGPFTQYKSRRVLPIHHRWAKKAKIFVRQWEVPELSFVLFGTCHLPVFVLRGICQWLYRQRLGGEGWRDCPRDLST